MFQGFKWYDWVIGLFTYGLWIVFKVIYNLFVKQKGVSLLANSPCDCKACSRKGQSDCHRGAKGIAKRKKGRWVKETQKKASPFHLQRTTAKDRDISQEKRDRDNQSRPGLYFGDRTT